MQRLGSLLAVLVSLAVAALCVRLGIWQLTRWQDKRTLVAALAERQSGPVTDVHAANGLTPALVGTRVRVHGEFDSSRHVLLAGRIEQGEPGVGLVSVLVLGDGGRALVDRGWVPALDARDAEPARYAIPGPQALLAVLDSLPESPRDAEWLPLSGDPPSRWSVGRLSIAGVRAHLGEAIAPYMLVALPEADAPVLPRRVAPPRPDPSMHLSYALQWFLFAAGTLAATGFIAWRRRGVSRA